MLAYLNKNKNISVNLSSWNLSFELNISFLLFSFYSEVRVEGLETLDYLENKERFTEQGDAITFESEVRILSAGASTISFHCFSTYDLSLVMSVLCSIGGQNISQYPHKNCDPGS